MLVKFFEKLILENLYKPYCVNCSKSGEWICKTCSRKLVRVFPECYVCRKISHHFLTHSRCVNDDNPYRRVFSAWYYQSLPKKMLSLFKYKGTYKTYVVFGELLLNALKFSGVPQEWNKNQTILTCIPLHSSKYRKRGFNQAELLMNYVGNQLGMKSVPDLLVRIRNNRTQARLNYKERRKNVKNLFKKNKKYNDWLQKKNFNRVVVFDDVVTTGSTLNAAGQKLQSSGVGLEAVCLFKGGKSINSLELQKT